MKSKDIKTDGTEYAVARAGMWNPKPGRERRRAWRAVVLDTGVSREVWVDFSRRTYKDGVRIKYLHKGLGEEIVTPAEIRQEWAEYEAWKEEQDGLYARQLQRDDRMAATMEAIKAAVPEDALPEGWVELAGDESIMSRERVGVHTLARLLTAAYEKGRESVLSDPDVGDHLREYLRDKAAQGF